MQYTVMTTLIVVLLFFNECDSNTDPATGELCPGMKCRRIYENVINLCAPDSTVDLIQTTLELFDEAVSTMQFDCDSIIVPPVNECIGKTGTRFVQCSHKVLEDVGLDNLAVRVCINVGNRYERSLLFRTFSGTAKGGEDYVSVDRRVSNSEDRVCIGIVILEDDVVEEDETFEVNVVGEGIRIFATVTILDDDGVLASYIGNSPVVRGNTISFDLSFRGDVVSARCGLLIGKRQVVKSEVDCSMGKANVTLQTARNSEYTPVITVIGKKDDHSVIMTTDRNIRLGVRGRCSVHLINDGITRASGGNGSVVTTIEWGLSAPSQSPFQHEFTGTSHTLTVSPTITGGCVTSVERTFEILNPPLMKK